MQTEVLPIHPPRHSHDEAHETRQALHKLNNHLAIIMANLHMCMQQDQALSEDQQDMLQQARRATHKAARLVQILQHQ